MKKLLFIGLLVFSVTGWSQNNALFDQGKEHYKNGKYQEAIASWNKILDNGQHAAEVYFNLGNAHYKLNQVAPSIFYYEKALQLAPNDSEIKNNLAFAENARIDAIEPLPKTLFAKWYNTIAGVLTYDSWAIVVVVASVLFVVFFLLYWFSSLEVRKRFYFITSIVAVVVLITSLVMAFQTYQDAVTDKPAIIFAEDTDVKNEPNMGGETAFVLHEGTKVQIIAEEEKWLRIRLANGKDGWIPASDLKRL